MHPRYHPVSVCLFAVPCARARAHIDVHINRYSRSERERKGGRVLERGNQNSNFAVNGLTCEVRDAKSNHISSRVRLKNHRGRMTRVVIAIIARLRSNKVIIGSPYNTVFTVASARAETFYDTIHAKSYIPMTVYFPARARTHLCWNLESRFSISRRGKVHRGKYVSREWQSSHRQQGAHRHMAAT